jgi:hypothetical protein
MTIESTGGRFLQHPDGSIERVEEPTAHHPDGDAPRTADGVLIGADGLPVAPPAPPNPEPPPPSAPDEEEI